MCDWHLEDAQPRPSGAHLHLEIPAVSHLAHAERIERLVTDGAKGAHVGVGNAVEQTSQRAGTVACHDLQRVHAAGLTLAACTRADHEVVCAAEDRAEQQRRELRPVAAIAVEEYDDVAVTRRPGPRCAGPAIAALPLNEDARARVAGALCGAILAAAVYGDDLIDYIARDGADYLCDRLFRVECRDHHCDPRTARGRVRSSARSFRRHHQRLQRSPQRAQAGGGWSLSSARRNSR